MRATDTSGASVGIATPSLKREHGDPASALRGLYAITPDIADTARLVAKAQAALQGGVQLLQYRNKQAGRALAQAQATALRAATRKASARLIINDDVDLALSVHADGVHLGIDDDAGRDFATLRRQAGNPQFIIGVSCYDELPRAIEAEGAGADYVAFGSFYSSMTKPGARRSDISVLNAARQQVSIPLVAIGGITLDNAPRLLAAGADALAVITAVFEAPDITATVQAFNQLFSRQYV